MITRTLFCRSHRKNLLIQARQLSDIHFNATDSEVEELIDQSLDKGFRKKDKEEHRSKIITTRRESLALYREILRTTSLFVWKDAQGRMWRDILRDSARKEFEAAKFESDPEIINRLLVVGRDAVHRVAEQFLQKREQIINDEIKARDQGQPSPSF